MDIYLNMMKGVQAVAAMPAVVSLICFLPSKNSRKKENGFVVLMVSGLFIAMVQTLTMLTLSAGGCFGMEVRGLAPYLCTGITVIWSALKLFRTALNIYVEIE